MQTVTTMTGATPVLASKATQKMETFAQVPVVPCMLYFCPMTLLHTDVDECTESPVVCAGAERCDNTRGSYQCLCEAGYSWDGNSCGGILLY